MVKYTFDEGALAHTMSRATYFIRVPDQVANDQQGYDGKTFPVIRHNGRRARGMLMGEEYDLYGPGTGDMVVKLV